MHLVFLKIFCSFLFHPHTESLPSSSKQTMSITHSPSHISTLDSTSSTSLYRNMTGAPTFIPGSTSPTSTSKKYIAKSTSLKDSTPMTFTDMSTSLSDSQSMTSPDYIHTTLSGTDRIGETTAGVVQSTSISILLEEGKPKGKRYVLSLFNLSKHIFQQ